MKVKRLIPAVAMLLISAMLLGTSTFAWFSMNTQVTAESIAIVAKSNARYLLINDTGTAASGSESLAWDYSTAQSVYPAKFLATGTTFNAGEANELVVPNNGWYTANNRNSDASTDAVFNYQAVTEADADYMATETMYLTLSADSEAWDGYVMITVDETDTNAAGSIVLKITNGATTTYTELSADGSTYIDCSTTNLTNANVITIVAYTYIDGTTTNVYSDFSGAPTSLTASYSLTFDLTETNS